MKDNGYSDSLASLNSLFYWYILILILLATTVMFFVCKGYRSDNSRNTVDYIAEADIKPVDIEKDVVELTEIVKETTVVENYSENESLDFEDVREIEHIEKDLNNSLEKNNDIVYNYVEDGNYNGNISNNVRNCENIKVGTKSNHSIVINKVSVIDKTKEKFDDDLIDENEFLSLHQQKLDYNVDFVYNNVLEFDRCGVVLLGTDLISYIDFARYRLMLLLSKENSENISIDNTSGTAILTGILY